MPGTNIFELRGERVVLRPLALTDVAALSSIAFEPDLWIHTLVVIRNETDLHAYVTAALAARDAGVAVPFLTTLADGTVVGSTRFGNIDRENRRVEIGWTWVGRPWQRTVVNTEAKYLMLRHAFEEWKCVRVEFKTGTTNTRSRQAILRLGAREEGILRRHMLRADGSWRDTVYYSILDSEWPDVRSRLQDMLRRGADATPSGP